MNLVDSHCHLDFKAYDSDRQEVLKRAWEAGLERILIPGISLASSHAVIALSQADDRLYAAIGVHPNDATTWNNGSIKELRAFIDSQTKPAQTTEGCTKSNKITAIGEIGLDYYRDWAPQPLQRYILEQQLELATELNLPVLLHVREAGDIRDGGDCSEDLLKLLGAWVSALQEQKHPLAKRPGVLHSFGGRLETAEEAIKLGFYIGVSGPVTFKNAVKRQEITAKLPLERLLIETDAPFLTPHPRRGQRNEPSYVGLVAGKISEIHNLPVEEVVQVTTANATRLFQW